jgi:predicted nucleic acid-binding Zn ribbon protein
MAKNVKPKDNKSEKLDYHTRQVRRTQFIFGIVAVLLIISMALSMVVNL